MLHRPPSSTRTATPFPYSALFRPAIDGNARARGGLGNGVRLDRLAAEIGAREDSQRGADIVIELRGSHALCDRDSADRGIAGRSRGKVAYVRVCQIGRANV